MEHIIQFGIGIDDEAIKKHISERAEKKIIEDISKEVKDVFFEKDWYDRYTNKPTQFVGTMVSKFMEENKDSIIELAAVKLVDKISKTKKFKETVNNIMEDTV